MNRFFAFALFWMQTTSLGATTTTTESKNFRSLTSVQSIQLWTAGTGDDQLFANIQDRDRIDISEADGPLTLVAEFSEPQPDSVTFEFDFDNEDGVQRFIDDTVPFSLNGDDGLGNFNPAPYLAFPGDKIVFILAETIFPIEFTLVDPTEVTGVELWTAGTGSDELFAAVPLYQGDFTIDLSDANVLLTLVAEFSGPPPDYVHFEFGDGTRILYDDFTEPYAMLGEDILGNFIPVPYLMYEGNKAVSIYAYISEVIVHFTLADFEMVGELTPEACLSGRDYFREQVVELTTDLAESEQEGSECRSSLESCNELARQQAEDLRNSRREVAELTTDLEEAEADRDAFQRRYEITQTELEESVQRGDDLVALYEERSGFNVAKCLKWKEKFNGNNKPGGIAKKLEVCQLLYPNDML